jgi:hypothetical protein
MPFEISDTKSFEENLDSFLETLQEDEPKLAVALKDKLHSLLRGEIEIADVWDALDEAGKEGA